MNNKTLLKVALPSFLITIAGIICLAAGIRPNFNLDKPDKPEPVVPEVVATELKLVSNKIIYSNADATNYELYLQDNALYARNIINDESMVMFDTEPVKGFVSRDDINSKLYIITTTNNLYVSTDNIDTFSFLYSFDMNLSATNVSSLKLKDNVLYYSDVLGNDQIVNNM